MSGSYASPPFKIGEVAASFFLGEGGDQAAIRESWSDQGLTVSIDFLVRWSDRIKLIQELNGSSSYSAPSYTRKLPVKLPVIIGDTSPGLPGQSEEYSWYRFACVGAGEFKPIKWRTDKSGNVTGFAGWGYYQMVVVPTTWMVPTYVITEKPFDPDFPGADISGFPYTTTRIKPSGESYSPYSTAYKYSSSDKQIDGSKVGLIRPKMEIAITRHYMPFVDSHAYDELIGKVNNAPMKFGNTEYPEESLLYLAYEPEVRGDVSTGGLTYDITHHLIANGPVLDKDGNPNSSWNYFVSPNGTWDLVVQADSGDPPYGRDNFKLAMWPEYD
jgi:hypothetical protein